MHRFLTPCEIKYVTSYSVNMSNKRSLKEKRFAAERVPYIWRYYTCVPTSASRFSFKMLTLYDLLENVGNNKKLTKWMKNYNIVRDLFPPPLGQDIVLAGG